MAFKSFIKSKHTHLFLGGIATAIAVPMIAKSQTFRKVVVQGMAKGMELQHEAQVNYESMKEEAQDMYYEARMEAEENTCATADEPKEVTE